LFAYYVQNTLPHTLDRARAIVSALPAGTVTVSPGARPLGWRTPWATTTSGDSLAGWRDWLAVHQPTFAVVDGSADHASAVKADGAAVAVIATPGRDVGKLGEAAGLDAGDAALAPWAAADRHQPGAATRTIHLGAVGWAAREATVTWPERRRPSASVWSCVALSPTGGGLGPRERRDLLRDTPAWTWWFASEREVLAPHGPIWGRLYRADVAVCAPTAMNLAAVAATRTPALLVLPAAPTPEQVFLADLAERTGAAVATSLPRTPAHWRTLLLRAQETTRGWGAWDPGKGLEQLRLLTNVPAPSPSRALNGLAPA
jgi:hypothetical protein